MNNSNLANKFQQLENNINNLNNLFTQKFLDLQNLIQNSITVAKPQNEFSQDYFINKESSDPDYVISNESDACLLIDGIIQRHLDWNNPNLGFSQKLKYHKTFVCCR